VSFFAKFGDASSKALGAFGQELRLDLQVGELLASDKWLADGDGEALEVRALPGAPCEAVGLA